MLYTEELIPIKEIIDGIIITEDNNLIKIFKIEPVRLLLMNEKDHDKIIKRFKQWLIQHPINFQIKMSSAKPDINNSLNQIREAYKKEDNENCKMLVKDHINFLRTLSLNDALDRDFALIITYQRKVFIKGNTLDYDLKEFKRIIDEIANEITDFGIHVKSESYNTTKTAEYIYNLLNPQTKQEISFDDRLVRLSEDIRKTYKLNKEDDIPFTKANVLVAPLQVDTEFSNDFIITDGMYRTTFAIRSDGYPIYVVSGWMDRFISLGENVEVDFFVKRENSSDFLAKTDRILRVNKIKAKNADETDRDSEEIGDKLASCRFVSNSIKNNEDIYFISTLITIHAKTVKELYQKKKDIINKLGVQFKFNHLKKLQKEAYISTLPLNNLDKRIFARAKQNITTSGLSTCFPFISYKLFDVNGIFYGINKQDRSLVMIDNFNSSKYVNPNILLFGTSGAGKTYTLALTSLHRRLLNTQCYIIAPDKQDEFRRMAMAVNGTFINIAPSSQDRINIFDIRPQEEPDEALVGEDYVAEALLSSKISEIKTFFSLCYPKMNIKETVFLDKTLKELYAEFGITEDNDSIYINPDNKAEGLKKMPIMEDLLRHVKSKIDDVNFELDALIAAVDQFVNGSATYFNGETNVDLDNKYVVFGLEKLNGDPLLIPAMYYALQCMWGKVTENKTQRKTIFIDEVWQLLIQEATAKYVQRIAKVIRGWGGSYLYATQSFKDADSKYGEAIITMSHIKFLLKCEEFDRQALKEPLSLTDAECEEMDEYRRGDALICINKLHVRIKVMASNLEHSLITTDREGLQEVINKYHSGELKY